MSNVNRMTRLDLIQLDGILNDTQAAIANNPDYKARIVELRNKVQELVVESAPPRSESTIRMKFDAGGAAVAAEKAAADQFVPGKYVKHKTGGPVMVIRQFNAGSGVVSCRYYVDERKGFSDGDFFRVELVLQADLNV